MKKLIYILSMTSILFITACSTTNIKKPNKGKSVDKISFKYMTPSHITENVEISSSESFDDIYNKLGYPYYEMSYTNKLSYKGYYKESMTATTKNYIKSNNLYKNYKTSSNVGKNYEGFLERKSGDNNLGTSVDFYYQSKNTSKKSIKMDDYSSSENTYHEKGFAGNTFSTSEEYNVTSGKYNITKTKEIEKTKHNKSTEASNNSLYEYVDDKAKIDFVDKIHYGYDSQGNKYSYSLSTFVNTSSIFDTNISNEFYNEEYDELYEKSVKLTDKYIILKVKCYYTSFMYDLALNELSLEYDKTFFDVSLVINKLKQLYSEDFKNAYRETEIWVDYNCSYDPSDDSVKKLAYAYYKNVECNDYKKKSTYDAKYLNYYYPGLDDSFAASLIGMTFENTYKSNKKEEIAINSSSYKNKIKNMTKKTKKNNIFDKIKMYESY